MAHEQRTRRRDEWKGLLTDDREFLKGIVQTAVQEVLELCALRFCRIVHTARESQNTFAQRLGRELTKNCPGRRARSARQSATNYDRTRVQRMITVHAMLVETVELAGQTGSAGPAVRRSS